MSILNVKETEIIQIAAKSIIFIHFFLKKKSKICDKSSFNFVLINKEYRRGFLENDGNNKNLITFN